MPDGENIAAHTVVRCGACDEGRHDDCSDWCFCDDPSHFEVAGWDPNKSIEENLLTPEDRKQLHDDLADMARLRRRAEAEARNIPLA